MEKLNIDLVFSINVYKYEHVLNYQLNTIKNHVKATYCVILNCNDEMFNTLKDKQIENVYINPEVINKKRFHGSLAQGIVSNMYYAMDKFNFKYFVILSGRTAFYNDMTIQNLENCIAQRSTYTFWTYEDVILKFYKHPNKSLFSSSHEGLCFGYDICNRILNFFTSNTEIKNILFNLNLPVEEFALQTIAFNEVNEYNLENKIFYIGNGVLEMYNKYKYTRKILYEPGQLLPNPMILRLKKRR